MVAYVHMSDDNFIDYKGKVTIEPGEDAYIRFGGYAGGVQVHINGIGVTSYMCSTSRYQDEDILAETASYIPLAAVPLTADSDFSFYKGINCVKVANDLASLESVTLVWGLAK